MKSAIQMQLNLMFKRKEFYIALMISVLISAFCFFSELILCYNDYFFFLNASSDFFYLRGIKGTAGIVMALYPFLIVLPFADSFITDYKAKITPVIQTRITFKNYYFSKMICVFLGAFIVLLIPQLLNLLANVIAYPFTSVTPFTGDAFGQSASAITHMQFPYLLHNYPNLYNLLFTFILSISGGIMAVGIYCISFFIKKSRLFIICIFFIISNILTFLGTYTKNSFNINIFIFPAVPWFPKPIIFPLCFFAVFIVGIIIMSSIALKRYKTDLI
ncbi:MAG: hypothetical protein RR306_05560 [Clostridia bacterium]